MANRLDNGGQEREPGRSRRVFLTWVGQVAAGISLAGIGLGLTNPSSVFAEGNVAFATDKPAVPDCIQCPPAGTFCCRSCDKDSNCQPGGYAAITYNYTGGCIPSGECPTTEACFRCVSSCPTNC